MSRKVILYVAMSLDGYIAKEDDTIDFLSKVESPGEDYGYAEFTKTVDTIIWGRKTYDKVKSFGIEFPHKDKKVYVLSKSKTGSEPHIQYFSDAKALIANLKKEPGKDIYCDGGSETVKEMLRYSLIDKMIISIIPHLVGSGIRLFRDGLAEQNIKLVKSQTFASGLVQLSYEKANLKADRV